MEAELKRLKVDPTILEGRTYVLNPKSYDLEDRILLDPYRIKEDFLYDLIDLCKSYASNERQRKVIDTAEQVIKLYSLPEPDYACKFLSKPGKQKFIDELEKWKKSRAIDIFQAKQEEILNLETHADKLCPGEVQFRLFTSISNTSCSFDELYQIARRKIRQKEIELQTNDYYSSLRNIFSDELIFILMSSSVPKTKVVTYTSILTRYNPSVYDPKNFGITDLQEYEISVCRKKTELGKAVKNSGACLNRNQIKESIDDEGTVNLVLRKDGETIGYARAFLMVSDKDEPVLAFDNFETGRKDFERHTDSIKAMGLAGIQLGLDSNIKYVVGDDARVKYGPKQAYGNKEKKIQLKQINPEPISPHYRIKAECKGTVQVLMENWRR